MVVWQILEKQLPGWVVEGDVKGGEKNAFVFGVVRAPSPFCRGRVAYDLHGMAFWWEDTPIVWL